MRSRITILVGVLLALAVTWSGVALAKEQPPPPDKMKKLSFPDFKEFDTDNGLEILVVEHREQPVITLYFVIKAGTALDPDGKEALASFVVDQLNKGTKTRSALELAEWVEAKGGRVFANSSAEFSAIGVTILSEYKDLAYEYLADVILNPTFPEDELEILRKRVKTALELERSNPGAMARRHLTGLMYGDHPYSKQSTVESVESISRDDVVDFYKRNYVANNVLFTVVGDTKWKDVRKSVENRFGGWQQGTPDRVAYASPPAVEETAVFLYHRPGAVQTEIYVGHVGPKAADPDWAAIRVANQILGDGAEGRLFLNLREDKGWTYGAYSDFDRTRDAGNFVAHAAVRTEVTDSALVEMIAELERITVEPVSDDDLDHAKSYLIGSFPLGIETPGQIASQIASNKLLGLDKAELEGYRDRVDAVTIADVSGCMSKHLRPGKAYVVLVGDAMEIKDKIEAVAAVSLYEIGGEPLSLASLAVEAVDYTYDTSVLKDMTATYSLTVQQMAIGDLNVSLKRKDGDVFEVSSNLAGMIVFDETMEFAAADLAPISFKRTMQMGPQSTGAEFAFTENGGSGTVQGRESPEPKEVTFSLVDGVIIDSAIEWALSCLPLEVNQTYRFPVVDTDSGALQNMDVTIVDVVTVETPAGSFSAYKVKVKGAQGESFVYIGKDNHMMVKTEMPAQSMTIELKSIAN